MGRNKISIVLAPVAYCAADQIKADVSLGVSTITVC